MKKLILVIVLLLFSCSKDFKEIEGTAVGHFTYDKITPHQKAIGIEKGNYYVIQTSSGHYFVFTANSTDIVGKNSKGVFVLGEEMFHIIGERYKDKKLVTVKITAYKLIEFKND